MTQLSTGQARATHAFTRFELLALVFTVMVLMTIALPLLAVARPESKRVGCFNNLRQVGRAARLWGNDHNDLFPWITSTTNGGTRPDSGLKTAVAWTEFITLSNELGTPNVLACPSDRSAKVASQWSSGLNGFANSGFRGNALSYFLNYHGQPTLPRSTIVGDRDFRPSQFPPLSCSRGNLNNAALCNLQTGPIMWTNELHAGAGHLVFVDGSVEFVNSQRFGNVMGGAETQDDAPRNHFINAR